MTSLHEREGAPAFKAPPQSCDAHFHVFGPAERYPYGADLRYKPPVAPLEDYLELARHLGIERYVFVQPSAYGRDNACLLDALRAVGEKSRGIVDIDENIPDAELERLNRLGVRGVRVNEDSFTIQLRDDSNRFRSFRKSDLKELKKEFDVSTMPSYKSLTAVELDDLVAYLASLRGEK